jgi:hypothetical protein
MAKHFLDELHERLEHAIANGGAVPRKRRARLRVKPRRKPSTKKPRRRS